MLGKDFCDILTQKSLCWVRIFEKFADVCGHLRTFADACGHFEDVFSREKGTLSVLENGH
jgi:hypothetical protein